MWVAAEQMQLPFGFGCKHHTIATHVPCTSQHAHRDTSVSAPAVVVLGGRQVHVQDLAAAAVVVPARLQRLQLVVRLLYLLHPA